MQQLPILEDYFCFCNDKRWHQSEKEGEKKTDWTKTILMTTDFVFEICECGFMWWRSGVGPLVVSRSVSYGILDIAVTKLCCLWGITKPFFAASFLCWSIITTGAEHPYPLLHSISINISVCGIVLALCVCGWLCVCYFRGGECCTGKWKGREINDRFLITECNIQCHSAATVWSQCGEGHLSAD